MGIGLYEYAAQQEDQPLPDLHPNKGLALEQEREQIAKDAAAKVYKEWQHNTIITRDLQRELLQGAKDGRSYADLLLIACKALAMTTRVDLIYKQIAEEVNRRENQK